MPFGMMSGVIGGMSVLDGGGHRRRQRDSFGREFGAATTLPKLLWKDLLLICEKY